MCRLRGTEPEGLFTHQQVIKNPLIGYNLNQAGRLMIFDVQHSQQRSRVQDQDRHRAPRKSNLHSLRHRDTERPSEPVDRCPHQITDIRCLSRHRREKNLGRRCRN